jgi:hypothetical protein
MRRRFPARSRFSLRQHRPFRLIELSNYLDFTMRVPFCENDAHGFAAVLVLGIAICLGGPCRDSQQCIGIANFSVKIRPSRPRGTLDDFARRNSRLGILLDGVTWFHPNLKHKFHGNCSLKTALSQCAAVKKRRRQRTWVDALGATSRRWHLAQLQVNVWWRSRLAPKRHGAALAAPGVVLHCHLIRSCQNDF